VRVAVAATVLACLAAARGDAQARDSAAAFHRIIQVYDRETQEGIEGVQVIDRITGNFVKSSATGHIVLVPQFVKPGGALLVFRKLGYDSVGPLLIDPRADTTLLVPMDRIATRLDPVTVNERYNITVDPGVRDGFEMRCAVRTTSCYRREDMLEHAASPLSYFLTRTDGVISGCGAAFTRGSPVKRPMGTGGRALDCVKMRGVGVQAGKLCIPMFFVDGFRRGNTDQTLDDLEQFLETTAVKGMEVYLSDAPIPMRFGGDAGCGSVAIWTK
jgi:hypothetical protein